MDSNCFSLKNLEIFKNNIFLYDYKLGCKESVLTYERIVTEVKKCVEDFEQLKLDHHVGIAIDMGEHSAGSCVLLLGILNYGCYFYCLDFTSTNDLFNDLTRSGVAYVITKDYVQFKNICDCACGTLGVFNEEYVVAKIKIHPQKISTKSRSFCYTITTSGSTGDPKVVHVPFECIEPNIKSLCSKLNIQQKDVIFLSSPPTFDPFVVEFFMALQRGASVLITSRSKRLTADFSLLQDVTIWQTTPSIFRLLGVDFIRKVVLQPSSALRSLLLGGESFPSIQEIQSWLPEKFVKGPKRIFNIYGITEISCWSTIYEYDAGNKYDHKSVPIGKPLDNFTLLRITDEVDGSEVTETCCTGELFIGSAVRRCFIPSYDMDVNTRNKDDVIYRKTGDIVERDKTGNIFYVGRTNNCIKRLGKRLCLDSLANKIENILKRTIVCLWDKECNKLILCIQQKGNETPNSRQDHSILKNDLSEFEQPDATWYFDILPLNKHGKVDRKKLLQDILQDQDEPNKIPLTIFQTFLKDILGFPQESLQIEILRKNKRSKTDFNISFIEAGGTSFQALSLSTEIGNQLQRSEDQRIFLEMLLSSKITIANILEFLSEISHVLTTNDQHFRNKELVTSITSANKKSIELLWRSHLKKCVDASPTLFQKLYVAVGSHSNLLLTLDAKIGSEISRIELPDRIECPVVFVSRDLALVGCYDGMLYGFNFNSGTVLWKLNANGMIKAKPLVMGNLIIVCSYAADFNIQAFDLETLKCVWCFKLGTKGIFSSPLKVSENSALFCGLDGTYALIQITTGTLYWLKKLDSPIFSTPAFINLQGNELVLAEVKGQIHVCNSVNGEEVFNFQADGNIFSSLTVLEKTSQNKLIIFGCHDGNVYCLSYRPAAKYISLVWKCLLNAAVYSTPILACDDTILACSTKGLIVLINLYSTELEAIYNVKAEIFSTPCILDNKFIYVGARDNFLYALEMRK